MDNLNKPTPVGIDFEHIFNFTPDLISILDVEHNIIRSNKAMNNCLGVSSGALVGSKCFWNMHQSEEPHPICGHHQMLKDGKEHTVELFIEPLNGYFSITVIPLIDKDGKISGSIHIARDITDTKAAAGALKKSQLLLKSSLERQKDTILFSIDKDRVNQALVDLIEKDDPYNIVFDIIPRNSPVMRTIQSIAQLHKDENGYPIKVIGVLHDITERKQLEDALVQEQNLLSALLDNLPDHIYFKDLGSRFVRNNRAHILSFGLIDPNQLVGKSDFDFFEKEVAQMQYEDEQKIIQTGESINKEEFTVRNDGSINWYYSTKIPLHKKDGSIIGTFGISRDIARQGSKHQIRPRQNHSRVDKPRK